MKEKIYFTQNHLIIWNWNNSSIIQYHVQGFSIKELKKNNSAGASNRSFYPIFNKRFDHLER